MKIAEIEAKMASLIKGHMDPGFDGEITEEMRFKEDLGLDSFEIVELLFDAEDQLGVKIPDEVAKSMSTVGDVMGFLKTGAVDEA